MLEGTSVVIVGAGFGGLAAAIELKRHGCTDITILEAASGIGGTWLLNTYPGAACDVPSHGYSLSYAQHYGWSRICSPQDEILAYVRRVAAEQGVDRLVTTDTKVAGADWDGRWTVTSEDGREWHADALVVATGQLSQPSIPQFPGAAGFEGPAFHSARWDHDVDLRGKRVAVIGTGASAVQFVPEIAEQAAQLTVFQRTGNWFLPRRNRPFPRVVRELYARVPAVQRTRRRGLMVYLELLTAMIRHPRALGWIGRTWSTLFMRMQLRDPEVRRKAWPDYTFGCKRVLFSSRYLPALQRPNVSLVTESVADITEDGVVTADGAHHPADVIVYGTGFKTTDFMFPMEIAARGVSLRDVWQDGAHAHLGMTVPGFPQLFVLYGPNTNTSGGSILVYLEAQATYVRQALEAAARRGAALTVRPEVEAASDRELQARFGGTAWLGCDSWYRTEDGRIVTNWPGYMREYVDRTSRFDPGEYETAQSASAAS
jgi:cation diffusion facilitator CzcD-associated flavoprotein CzcO